MGREQGNHLCEWCSRPFDILAPVLETRMTSLGPHSPVKRFGLLSAPRRARAHGPPFASPHVSVRRGSGCASASAPLRGSGRTREVLRAHAQAESGASVSAAHVNSLVLRFSLGPERYARADPGAGSPRACRQKRLPCACCPPARWAPAPRPPHARAGGTHVTRPAIVSRWELFIPPPCVFGMLMSEGKEPNHALGSGRGRTGASGTRGLEPSPHSSRCPRQAEAGPSAAWPLPKFWTLAGVWELAQRN